MRPRSRRRRSTVVLALVLVLGLLITGLTAARAVLFPQVDSPERVDAIVVVAGSNDDRYVYARSLAEEGVADHILVSQPPSATGRYAAAIDSYCASTSVIARDGRRIDVECFAPDVDTTEGETTAATRIARERGHSSLLVVTYWGHVSRVRMYFEQCFDGPVYVTDTPRPTSISRRYALLHETGGYLKAFIKPAC
ncbi:YdcF family protein [Dietzia maris]|uniref:ElyC/SanA/YdcF family protein n=1 Tax=Dietzia maris TaxID=37915 RepID=UPI0022B2B483|nr:ElyC/SanA/YdcF family protein [Dietzia maris]MCZ4540864.1 YdcF family protein [Dietzia maris]